MLTLLAHVLRTRHFICRCFSIHVIKMYTVRILVGVQAVVTRIMYQLFQANASVVQTVK
jgi:hypothetical protein